MPSYLANAEPFFFTGNHIGCLLIHGFTGTPHEMRGLGEHLAEKGYTAFAPALSGHATNLSDLAPTRWYDWYASVRAAFDKLSAACDFIIPIGLSLGGALALHLAAHQKVSAVIAVSTPFTIQNPFVPLFTRFPFLVHVIHEIPKNPKRDDTQDPRVHAQHPGYRAYPVRAAASLIQDFLPHLHNDLREIRAPALLIQSRGDQMILPTSMDDYCARIGSGQKEMFWVEQGGHLLSRFASLTINSAKHLVVAIRFKVE
ncbi:MAG: alpha/beta fold hydrolase [Chloroflexi bacterium]|nr:alpha/beta fold hydrolase [Chloroflexota bacterium]